MTLRDDHELRSGKVPLLLSIALCLLSQYLISFKLWVGFDREFPLLSAFESLPISLGPTIDALLLTITIVSLALVVLARTRRVGTALFLLCSILFVLEDITRLQPWLYIFAFLFLIVAVRQGKRDDVTMMLITLVLAATYFWSGAQKLNNAFTMEVVPWLVSPFGLDEFMASHRQISFALPFIEIFAGIGLLFERTRRAAGITGIAIHLFLLAALGPWGLDWNKVIWPWNLEMAIIFWLLYVRRDHPAIASLSTTLRESRALAGAIVFITAVLPILNYVGMWDNHLSGSLYSGNNSEGIFYYDESDRAAMPPSALRVAYYYPETRQEFILLDNWTIDELEAPFYPQERYFKRLGRILAERVKKKENAGIRIAVKERFTSEERLVEYRATELTPPAR